jgi:hypothetical protein
MADKKSELLHDILKRDFKKNRNVKNVEEKESDMKQKILEMSEISLILDSYDDIFSDFDPRPFSQRALSDDLLLEAKRAARDKIEGMELKFLIPHNKRSLETENMVKKRLHEHFRKHHDIIQDEIKKTVNSGIFLVVLGMILMSSAAFISHFLGYSFLWGLLVIVFEPAGWFTVWTGFDRIFNYAKSKSQDLGFYRKMTKAEISFNSY